MFLKRSYLLTAILLCNLIGLPLTGHGADFLTFDDFPATSPEAVPGDSIVWQYSSKATNPSPYISSCGWISDNTYDSGIFNLFNLYSSDAYNSDHMGYNTYGYLEIDDKEAVRGRSLRITTTGGKKGEGCDSAPCEFGVELHSKEEYLNLKDSGVNVVSSTGEKVGHPTIYFMNSSASHSPRPFPEAKDCNRLSIYIKLPNEIAVSYSGKPNRTLSVGPYNDVGGHWYNDFMVAGGGWTHLVVDGHPSHNNSWHNASKYPYPSASLRNMDVDYFNSMYRFYLTLSPYSGVAAPVYQTWIDEVSFYFHDGKFENNETINSPSVGLNGETNEFNIGFFAKYKNNSQDSGKYDIRYSFSPISNENYDSATPVHILDNGTHGIKSSTSGHIYKKSNYYPQVWAGFRLRAEDEGKIEPGVKIYFAIKDISDRSKYDNNPELFDVEGDREQVNLNGMIYERIDLIKTIDYHVSELAGLPLPSIPGNVRLIELP